MSGPFSVWAAAEQRNVEPGTGKLWAAIKIEALGPALEVQRAPLAIVLVVDVSGSMAGEPLEHALRSCEILAGQLGDADQLAIVTFSTHASVRCGLTTVDESGRDLLRASLRGVRASGNTNLQDGLGVAGGILQQAPAGLRRVMVLLSDGRPNCGLVTPVDLAAYVRSLGVAVSSLGLGRRYDEDVLDAIATAGSGRYGQIADPEMARVDLARAALAQGGIVADHLELRLTPSDGIKVLQVLPAGTLRYGAGSLAISVGDVFTDEGRTFAVELQFDLRSHLAGRILEVAVDGKSSDGIPHQASATVSLDIRAGSPIINRDAQREVMLLQADVARRMARAHSDRGATSTATSILREMIARLEATDGFVRNDRSRLAELREQMEDEAASYGRRVTSAERSHQRKAAMAYKLDSPAYGRARRERPPVAAQLIGLDGPVARQTFRLWNENIIGRSAVCDIPVDSTSLSRNHARVQFLDGHFLLIDLGATHGTALNGRAVQSGRLGHGDLIRLGDAVFRFELSAPVSDQLPLFDGT